MFGTGGFQFNSPQPKTTTTALTFGTANPIMTTPSSLQSAGGTALTGTMFGSTFTTSASPMFRGLNTTTVTSTPTTGIFSGLQPKSTSLLGFGFGTGNTTTTAPSTLNVGLGSTLPVSSVPAATTPNVGLGGVDLSQTSAGLSGRGITSGQSDNKAAVKETVLPNEISDTLETFKKYVKEQKIIREEITRVSSKSILKVQKETTALKQMLSVVSNGLQRNAVAIEKLKLETSQELKNAEIAQRTKDTPPALQYENVAPTEYFQQLVANFERQMQSCRQQIEQLEKHLTSISHPALLTPQELTAVMKRLHETFVALASNLQVIHEAVQHQKEQFLCYRGLLDGDISNVFQVRNRNNISNAANVPKIPVTVGPAPFSNTPSPAAIAMATALNRTHQLPGGPPSVGTPHSQGPIGTGGFCSGGLGTGLGTGSFGTQSSTFSSGPSLNFGTSSTAFKPLGK